MTLRDFFSLLRASREGAVDEGGRGPAGVGAEVPYIQVGYDPNIHPSVLNVSACQWRPKNHRL